MALTLIEAAKLVDGEVKRQGVIETFAAASDLMRLLPFKDVQGGAYTYNLEAQLPGIGFRGINEAYTESVGVINPETERLRIMGGDLDVDKALIKMHGLGVRTSHEVMKVKAASMYFLDQIINGNSIADPRTFDGLRARVGGSQLVPANVAAPAANSPLSLEALQTAIDAVDGPNAIIVSKYMRRKLSKAARLNLGGDIEVSKDEFGFNVERFNGVPMYVVDYNHTGARIIDLNEAGPAGGTTSTSIYVGRFEDGYISALQNGILEVQDLGEIDSKPVFRTRVDWLCGLCVEHPRALARVWGITGADATA